MQTRLLYSKIDSISVIHVSFFFLCSGHTIGDESHQLLRHDAPWVKKDNQEWPVPTRSRNFLNSCEVQGLLLSTPILSWHSRSCGTFSPLQPCSLPTRRLNTTMTVTLLQSQNVSVNLPSRFPSSLVAYSDLTSMTSPSRRLGSWVGKSTLCCYRTLSLHLRKWSRLLKHRLV